MAAITVAAPCSSCLAASSLASLHSVGSAKHLAPVTRFQYNAKKSSKSVRCQARDPQANPSEMHTLTRREALGAAAAALGLSQLSAPAGAQEEFNTFYGKAGGTRRSLSKVVAAFDKCRRHANDFWETCTDCRSIVLKFELVSCKL